MFAYIKKLTIVTVLLIALIISGCEKNDAGERNTEELVSELGEIASVLLADTNLSEVYDDLLLPEAYDGATITWMTTNSSVLLNDGTVFRPVSDTEVKLYAFIRKDGYTVSKTFMVTVKSASAIDPNPKPDPDPDPDPLPGPFTEYYRGAEGKTGSELKSFLHNLIDDHQTYSYDFAKTALKETDEDPENPDNVILFYTGRSQDKDEFGSSGDVWNREHVWAKSHGGFGESRPAGSDLHHLRPTDASVNLIRNNKDFDEGGSIVNDTYGPGSSYCYTDSDSFEPRDEVKGDVARILFYMAVRYEGDSGEPNLELNDQVNNGSSPYMGKLSVLLEWNKQDPVDDFERNRNEVIFDYQGNRNPFIDYPEFADLIFTGSTAVSYKKSESFARIPMTIVLSSSFLIEAAVLERNKHLSFA